MPTEYVLFFPDPHCGSKLGLCNPATVLDYAGPNQKPDRKPVELREWQKFLWNKIVIPGLDDLAQRGGDNPVTIICGGDIIQGNLVSQSLISPKLEHQDIIATDVFGYFFAKLN